FYCRAYEYPPFLLSPRKRLGDSRDSARDRPCQSSNVRRSVLIVDDHAGFRSAARALLQASGFDVVGEADDGASALAAAQALRPQGVLLDIELPDMDGFDVGVGLIGEQGAVSAIVVVSCQSARGLLVLLAAD